MVDGVLVISALICAYLIRFDFSFAAFYKAQFLSLLPIFVLIRVSALYYVRAYHFVWRYAGISDLVKVLKAVVLGLLFLAVVNYFRNYPIGMMLALAFFISALFHRGVIHFLPRVQHKRLLVGGAVGLSLVLLAGGFLAFTILSSAPVHLTDIPLGERLQHLEFEQDLAMPRGVLVMESILSFLLLGGLRIAPRLFSELLFPRRSEGRRTLIFGAGDVGEALVRAIKRQAGQGYRLLGFVDDDPAKQRASIHGVAVLGTRRDLPGLIDRHQIQELLITPVSLSAQEMREIAQACWQKRVSVRRVAGLASMVAADVGIEHLESVDIAELLGRPEVELDPGRVSAYLQDQVVLVTGAGGSIGSELCRQVSQCRPARLILLGRGENSIYAIQNELRAQYPALKITSVIGDICDSSKIDYIFRTWRPEVVFHAAAYKHVPFMEDNPEEAVHNNIFGTRTVAQAALRHGTSRFVLISSDKAVNPTSIMGATKKVAELVLQQLALNGQTQFITVRFGNVLRSRGSVIPLFEQQIEAGGPVTVTHPEMTRYFMSIPEAVRLVLHSGAIGHNGDLCILDMGKQVKILELAENMIRMAGKEPYEEIEIVFTGIRPGEKLSEELFTQEEARSLQRLDRIFISRPEGCDWQRFDTLLELLYQAAQACHRQEIVRLLGEILPNYRPYAGEVAGLQTRE